jgi:hypothetical protein
MALLLVSIMPYGSLVAQKSNSATSAESPEHFMRRVLQIANGSERGIEILDMSERVYSAGFLDAMFGEGCFTTHRLCIIDHGMWARICGCRNSGATTCGCPGKLKFSELSVARADSNSADVSALLNLEPNRKDKVTWRLVMTSQGWRIDDVVTPDIPSLKAKMSR